MIVTVRDGSQFDGDRIIGIVGYHARPKLDNLEDAIIAYGGEPQMPWYIAWARKEFPFKDEGYECADLKAALVLCFAMCVAIEYERPKYGRGKLACITRDRVGRITNHHRSREVALV